MDENSLPKSRADFKRQNRMPGWVGSNGMGWDGSEGWRG